MSPFWRNLAILAAVAAVIVVLNPGTAPVPAARLLRVAVFVGVGGVADFFWRGIRGREIDTWPRRAATVFYLAVGLLVVDVGWYAVVGVSGRDALAFFVVAGICAYVGIRTWRSQKSYL